MYWCTGGESVCYSDLQTNADIRQCAREIAVERSSVTLAHTLLEGQYCIVMTRNCTACLSACLGDNIDDDDDDDKEFLVKLQ